MSGRRKWSLAAAFATCALASGCVEPTSTAPEAAPAPTPSATIASAATLISCPTDQPAVTEATIGLLGGLLSLGNTSISVPVGAILKPTTFRISVPASNYMEISVTGGDAEHFVFERPVAITIDYSRCDRAVTDAAPLTVFHIDETTKVPLEDMGGIDDRVARRITFQTGHLSGYAIAN